MDFFERQDRARKATTKLVVIYVLFVVALIAAILPLSAGIGTALQVWLGQDATPPVEPAAIFESLVQDPRLILFSVLGVLLVVGGGAMTRMVQLRQGGSKVAVSLGGREVLPATQDYKERRLLNVVEEMAIASGVPMPRVFVLDAEPGINAFAAGFSTQDAAVAVTRGALDLFNREELQAVIGHEFSHIMNGDMRLNIRMMSILFGILCIAILGRSVIRIGQVTLHAPRRSKKDNSAGIGLALLACGAAVWVIGSIGVLCARILQAMVSRQREHLADASAVQFTRNPAAMAQALKVIGAHGSGGRMTSTHASEISHMLFASGVRMNLFATHPPLEDRIRSLDPQFKGDYKDVWQVIKRRQAMQAGAAEEQEEDVLHETLLTGAAALHHGMRAMRQAEASDVPSGTPETAPPPPPAPETPPVACPLPDDARVSLRTPLGSQACISAAVLGDDPAVRQRQLTLIEQSAGADFLARTKQWSDWLSPLPMAMRRMTCERAVNTLRALPRPELEKTLRALDQLVAADGRINAFEFALTRMFRRRLLPDVANSRKAAVHPPQRAREAAYALSVLARFGTTDTAAAEAAWHAGLTRLAAFEPVPKTAFTNPVDLPQFEQALHALVALPPIAKRAFIEACEAVAGHDGTRNETEDNFLFAISDLVEAPPTGS